MHRDKRIGLALGILLLGIVGAFFFRNEGDPILSPPELSDPGSLDEQIAENPVTPYLEEYERDGGAARPSAENTSQFTSADAEDNPWGPPDFLRTEKANADLPGAAGPPNPIDTRAPAVGGIPIPRENDAWEPVAANERPRTSRKPEMRPAANRVVDGYIIHRVKKGDTLSELAQKYLGSSARFLELYEMNKTVLRSPDDLRLGMMIRIPADADNKPRRARRADRVEARPISVRDDAHPKGPEPTKAASPQTPEVKPAEKPAPTRKRRFIPVRRSPLVPGSYRKRASVPQVPVDDVPRQLTQLPKEPDKTNTSDGFLNPDADVFED